MYLYFLPIPLESSTTLLVLCQVQDGTSSVFPALLCAALHCAWHWAGTSSSSLSSSRGWRIPATICSCTRSTTTPSRVRLQGASWMLDSLTRRIVSGGHQTTDTIQRRRPHQVPWCYQFSEPKLWWGIQRNTVYVANLLNVINMLHSMKDNGLSHEKIISYQLLRAEPQCHLLNLPGAHTLVRFPLLLNNSNGPCLNHIQVCQHRLSCQTIRCNSLDVLCQSTLICNTDTVIRQNFKWSDYQI